MIPVKFLLMTAGAFFFLVKSIEFLYRYQIKEYRFDRMRTYIRETGWGELLYGLRYAVPARKIRNIAIAGVMLIICVMGSIFSYYLPFALLVIAFFLSPVFAFATASLLVAITNIPVHFHREGIIKRSAEKIGESRAEFIAVTGSYGKSSVKELLYALLSSEFETGKTDNNMNTDVGVALSVLKHLNKSTRYFVAEVGAYRIGEIAKICKVIKPEYVVITAFGNQHLDLYGSHEALVEAESEPLAFMPKKGRAYINKDIPEYQQLVQKYHPGHTTYSVETDMADIVAKKIHADHRGTSAEIHVAGNQFAITTQLLGKHVIQNLLPAIALALDLGITRASIQKVVAELAPIEHKLSLHKGPGDITVISDSANSNVNGFIEAIHILNTFPHKKKILVSKGIIELGSEKSASYEKILKELAATNIRLLTTDPLFGTLSKQAVAGRGEGSIALKATEEEMGFEIEKEDDKNTVLLIEGRFTEGFVKYFTQPSLLRDREHVQSQP